MLVSVQARGVISALFVAEAVPQLLMEADTERLTDTGKHERVENRTIRPGRLNLRVPKLQQDKNIEFSKKKC